MILGGAMERAMDNGRAEVGRAALMGGAMARMMGGAL